MVQGLRYALASRVGRILIRVRTGFLCLDLIAILSKSLSICGVLGSVILYLRCKTWRLVRLAFLFGLLYSLVNISEPCSGCSCAFQLTELGHRVRDVQSGLVGGAPAVSEMTSSARLWLICCSKAPFARFPVDFHCTPMVDVRVGSSLMG